MQRWRRGEGSRRRVDEKKGGGGRVTDGRGDDGARPSPGKKKKLNKQRRKSGHTKSRTKTMSNKWVHIFLYTFIYLHISSNISKQLYIHSYTPAYIKILNTEKMRANIKHTSYHNSGPRAFPRGRIWSKYSYHVPRCFAMPNGGQN